MDEEIDRYYLMALMDLASGASVDELERAIKLYEILENYEACAGILKAINENKYYDHERFKKYNKRRDNN
jgi:hypothetical protein|tara:strand:+ start:230 stop:439 length:210 start_codon:yes stop_codon:yes gene_type:complete